ncbi:RNA polymerase sigma factor SigZ [Candidatus Entotheonella serta]|nr:RNA polymerase sigma factor SigZ [Candidatus Entotheonella serta]
MRMGSSQIENESNHMDIKQVWQDYRHELERFLLSRISNPDDAEDVLQDIMIKAYQHLHTVQDPSKLRYWLFQVTRNEVTDYYRRAHQAPPDASFCIDEGTERYEQVRYELAECINVFIKQLPETYQFAVEAVDLHGVSQKALSEELGVSYSAVKSRVQRGRQMLADLFEAYCRCELDTRGNIIDYQSKRMIAF